RTGPALVENSSLDAFAAMRFQTAVSQFTISDYGFDRQAAAFFGDTVSSYNEEILYPSSFTPYQFAAYLGQSAPGHWNELTNPSYRQFGYFLGTGPAVVVNDCSVTEITSMNINITQFAIQHGCDYKVQNVIYLIIVLSS
ncbi:MAG TPA: hypothetical protein VEB67_01665, partial [Nitrososphaerales archaeon]|nr:hypothetical protein [Nitrososphaerales archaeon]